MVFNAKSKNTNTRDSPVYPVHRFSIPCQTMQRRVRQIASRGFGLGLSQRFGLPCPLRRPGHRKRLPAGHVDIPRLKEGCVDVQTIALFVQNYTYPSFSARQARQLLDAMLKAIKQNSANYVGLSALLTTTMVNMEKTVKEIKSNTSGINILIGGAPVNDEFRIQIGADFYSPDPQGAVEYLNKHVA